MLPREFLSEVEKYTLLSPARLAEARDLCADVGTDAKNLAAELIRRDWLTPFQANRLLQGRGSSLVLGPYVLLERLGGGSMGEVFKARHRLMDRLVALKVIRADRLDRPESLSRFRREMQAAAKLAHPNVVLAHDADLAGDVYFLAMEYVEGTDLKQLLEQRGRLSPSQACEYIRQAALGLQHAHERGLVHRDVKPSNLILEAAGNVVKVLDLGLARLRLCREQDATTSELTLTGSVMGTPDYLAPEQAVNPRTADIRADIYSLGCTLYHLLTGQPPFPGDSLAEKLLYHQQAIPQAVESLAVEVPAELARVVRRMMAKQPDHRYQTPREVADALVPFVSLQTVPPRRRRVVPLKAWVACLAVALAVGIGVYLIFLRPAPGSNPLPEEQSELSPRPETGPADVEDNRPNGPKGGGPVEIDKLAAIPANGPARLIEKLEGHTGTIQCLVFSPDGKQLASGGDDHQVRLWDGLTGKRQGDPLQHSDSVRALAFSLDGKHLASASHSVGYEASIKLWDLVARREPRMLPWKNKEKKDTSLADVRSLAFSADGKRLAAGGGPLRLWDLDKGGEPAVFDWQKTSPSYLYGVALSPDGKTVAGGCHEMSDSVRLWKVDAPASEPAFLQGNTPESSPSHRDVRAVLAYAAGGTLLIRVTSDGRGIGFQEPTASVMLWDVDPKSKQVRRRNPFTIPGGAVFALASAADGHLRVAVAAGKPDPTGSLGSESPPGEVKLWDEATRQVRRLQTDHEETIMALAFSPDGTRLATGSADQSVKLWDLTH